MQINNPITAAGVWSNATRTLTADPATDAGAATLVWARATRNLTNIGAQGAAAHTAFTNIASATTLDLRPGANKMRECTLAMANNAPGSTTFVGLYDGTNFIAISFNVTSNEGSGAFVTGDNSVGPAIKNADASGRSYMGFFMDWAL